LALLIFFELLIEAVSESLELLSWGLIETLGSFSSL
jgi:hypothetical protein